MFSLKSEKKWIVSALLTIIALFAAVNIYSVIKYNNYFLLGSLEKADNDDVKYIRSAWTLLEKGILTYHDTNNPTVYIMPGHPLILTVLTGIFGKTGGITAFRLFQIVLQALSLGLVFLIGRTIFNSLAGITASFLDAIYWPEYFAAGTILTEVEFKFLLLLLVYISVFAVRSKKKTYYIAGGLVLGITCLIRPTIAIFPAIILTVWLFFRYTPREIIKFSIPAALAFIIVMSPWWVRNYMVFDRFIPLTLSSGNPFLQGTYINYDQSVDPVPYTPDKDVIKTNEIEMETGKYRLKTHFKKEPLKYVYWYTIGKSRYFWKDPFYWRTVFGISPEMSYFYHYFILITGLFGAILSIVRKNIFSLIIIITIIYFNIAHLPFFTF
ncbi:MAG: glycosyltransferase family 39 protein, partial [Clostridiaceae bacterium]|nr:glycosyltransferase family 39 protein [Clostridiaceae bacterium]